MAESLLVGRNFVSGICKLKQKKTKNLKPKNLKPIFCFIKPWVFTSPASHGEYGGAPT